MAFVKLTVEPNPNAGRDGWIQVLDHQINCLELIAAWGAQVNMGNVRDKIREAINLLKQEKERLLR